MIKILTNIAVQLIFSLGATIAIAQETTTDPWRVSNLKTVTSIKKAAIAKVYPDKSGNELLGIITFQESNDLKDVTVIGYKSEIRTRMKTDPFTETEVVVQYRVLVPYSETAKIPEIKRNRVEVQLSDAAFWDSKGKKLSIEEAAATLKTTKKCLIVPMQPAKDLHLDPFFTRMLNEDVLFVWYPDYGPAKPLGPIQAIKTQ